MTATGWAADADLDIAEWAATGRRLGELGRGVGWWIGDWVRYGNARFGERYVRAGRITGYDVQTLMNMVYVASRFDSSRRRARLSWSHHAEVAALAPSQQERWLDRAETERLSVRCLREELRRARTGEPEPEAGDDAPAGDDFLCPQCGYRIAAHPPDARAVG